MKKLCVIGEALIDFIPEKKGQRLKDVTTFRRVAGGAPANVAVACCRLGGKAKMVTQLGEDAFGDYIIETLESSGVETADMFRTKDADTALAFVSLANDGNRDFKFYRRTSADIMLSPEKVDENTLKDCGILHFCSVDLVEGPMKHTHKKLIELALQQGVCVSFDPNVRLSLWSDETSCQKAIREFIPYAHILKIADEELAFITGETTIEAALPKLCVGNVRYVIYTKGKDGACLFIQNHACTCVRGHQVEVCDTTGAGDSFIGAFLYKFLAHNLEIEKEIDLRMLHEFLSFSNDYAAHTTTKVGAIDAMATQKELQTFRDEKLSL